LGMVFTGDDPPRLLVVNEGAGTLSSLRLTDVRWIETTLADSAATACAWGDCDGDGDADVYVVHAGLPNVLLRNDGGILVAAPADTDLADEGDGTAASWVDFDGDGDLDLFLANRLSANRLFRNDGGGMFVDVADTTMAAADRDSRAGAWADYDLDERLDLYVSNSGAASQLFRNLGGGSFAEVTVPPLDDPGPSRGVAWADYDVDGDMDLYVAKRGTPNRLFRNDGPAGFHDVATGIAASIGNAVTADWGDYDNDVDLDLIVAFEDAPNVLLRNDGASLSAAVLPATPAADTTRTVSWMDYNNDGWLDLYVVNRGRNVLYRNDGDGSFTDRTADAIVDSLDSRAVAWGDGDLDGRMDALLSDHDGASRLLRNNAQVGNHWLQVDLRGTISPPTPVGSRATLYAGGVTQVRVLSAGNGNELVLHFGLGAGTNADSLRVLWTSGVSQLVAGPTIDRRLLVIEESEATPVVDIVPLPLQFALYPAFPNPFRRGTTIRYDLPRTADVHLRIYDVAGRLVRTLERGRGASPGAYQVIWDGRNGSGRLVASGVYFYRLDAGDFRDVRKIVRIR
ncbi:FG-GAP-like repeat-containing protein, partial [bacterium]|nr:FG-GAP-like repeat-containing protein [bacterium]